MNCFSENSGIFSNSYWNSYYSISHSAQEKRSVRVGLFGWYTPNVSCTCTLLKRWSGGESQFDENWYPVFDRERIGESPSSIYLRGVIFSPRSYSPHVLNHVVHLTSNLGHCIFFISYSIWLALGLRNIGTFIVSCWSLGRDVIRSPHSGYTCTLSVDLALVT